MSFCPKGTAICKISRQIIWGNSKQEKFLNDLITKESYVLHLLDEFIQMHLLFCPKRVKKVPFFYM